MNSDKKNRIVLYIGVTILWLAIYSVLYYTVYDTELQRVEIIHCPNREREKELCRAYHVNNAYNGNIDDLYNTFNAGVVTKWRSETEHCYFDIMECKNNMSREIRPKFPDNHILALTTVMFVLFVVHASIALVLLSE